MIRHKRAAFTLAEMMVVMLILTILLAAFAPLMTKKSKVDLSNPWRWAGNNSDIYYGIGNKQTAMIGQNNKANTDPNAKLLINSPNGLSNPHITFKEGNDIRGYLLFRDSNIFLSSGNNDAKIPNISGTGNVAIGKSALANATTTGSNIAIGENSLASITKKTQQDKEDTFSNIGIGSNSLNNLTNGNGNISIGAISSQALTAGTQNISLGNGALYQNKTGSRNIAIGPSACNGLTSASNKVCIGYLSGPISGDSTKDTDSEIHLGGFDGNTTVYIPGNVVIGGSVVVAKHSFLNYLWVDSGENSGSGNGTFRRIYTNNTEQKYLAGKVQDFYIDHTTTTNSDSPSDKRLKKNITENNAGLEKIKQLKVFSYTFKKDEKKTPRVGVIAQDLIKVFPDAVQTGDDGYLHIRTEDMFYAAINAIKELDKMLQDIVAQVKTVVAQVNTHDTQIKALQKENKELKAKVQTLEKQNKSFEARLKAIEKKL